MQEKIVYMPQDPTLLFVKDQLFEDLLEVGKEKEVKSINYWKWRI